MICRTRSLRSTVAGLGCIVLEAFTKMIPCKGREITSHLPVCSDAKLRLRVWTEGDWQKVWAMLLSGGSFIYNSVLRICVLRTCAGQLINHDQWAYFTICRLRFKFRVLNAH